ncbi:recombinase family protein [Cutibacterium avidum]|uniref:recombinase family protein n=1 Tax=Cutibacterium avidum TaxID=33010 RepID=UPI0003A9CCDF|nr:recombinase family protein [Cutibacterium avidum]MDU5024295.1 recombinase family protein [Cutibacterium avidum]
MRVVARTVQAIPAKPVAPRRVRVGAYARVSTGSERQLSSLSEQVSHYSRLIQATPGWDYAGVYIDEGITGTKTTTRDGLQDLLTQARAGKVDVVLCKSISRLARNTVDLLAIIRELKALGVSVRFEREGIDTATSDGELLLTLLASFAQEESRSLSDNVKWSIQRRFTQGIPNSTLIYGYRWEDGQFVIQPEEAEAIRLAYEWFTQEGISPETIAARLNQKGYRSRFGKRIEPNLIRRALRNERYTGMMVLQKYYSSRIGQNNPHRNTGQLPKYLVEDSHLAIITGELFEAAQAEIARRKQGGLAAIPTINTGCVTARITCAGCGKHYQRKSRTTAGGKERYWRCWSACKGNGNPCRGHNLRETMLETIMTCLLGLEVFDPHTVMTHVEAIEAFPDRLDIHLLEGITRTVWLDEKGHAR